MASFAVLYFPARSFRVFAALPNCNANPTELSIKPMNDTGSILKDYGSIWRGDSTDTCVQKDGRECKMAHRRNQGWLGQGCKAAKHPST